MNERTTLMEIDSRDFCSEIELYVNEFKLTQLDLIDGLQLIELSFNLNENWFNGFFFVAKVELN